MLRGRDELLAGLETALDGGAAVVLAGPPGSGRSALLSALAARRPGARRVAGLRTTAPTVPLLVCSWAATRDLGGLTPAEVAGALAGLPGPLLVDDADDADPASVEALSLLAGRAPLVVAVTAGGRAGEVADRMMSAGAATVALPPLEPAEAVAVAGELGAADPAGVARRSGGNPGLLVALARGSEPPARPLASVDAVVTGLSPPAAGDLAVAGLLGHDLAPGDLAAGAELEAAALLSRGPDGWSLRHGLAAERALARLAAGPDPAQTVYARAARLALDPAQTVYARAARLALDPARTVELLEAAGDRSGAADAARTAAAVERDPARRARLLGLVAGVTGDPGAALDAAAAAVRAADGPLAAHYADPVPAGAAVGGGLAVLRKAQAARLNGDEQAALAAMAELGGPDPDPEVSLERARLQMVTAWVPPGGPARPGAAGALLAGLAEALALGPGAPDALAMAAAAAREEDDRDLELAARAARMVALTAAGDGEAARAEAAALAARVDETGARSWRDVPARLAAALAVHQQADPGPLLDLAAGGGAFGPPVTAHLAVALADVGRTGEAAALVEAGPWPATPVAQGLRWWAAAEAAASAGRLRTALTAAGECLDVSPPGFPGALGAVLVAARAAVDADQEVPPVPPGLPLPGGARSELEALTLQDAGDLGAAAAGHEAAAAAWAGGNRRAALRCRWAAADLRLRAAADGPAGESGESGESGAREGAVDTLRRLDEEAGRLGLRPLSARIRRSLRAAGVRLAGGGSEGDRRGPLSPRESEVLGLVGAGRSSAEIAAHLGVATSTVETQIKSAIRKLGATNRRHAAALLAEADGR